jgi:NAD(P)-dependent dehydrogenase (short-subunit alcohol dehydrogenase family)
VEGLKADSSEATFVKVDVFKLADGQEMVKATVDTYNNLDVLLNNGGIQGSMGIDLVDDSIEESGKLIALNFKGVWFGMKYAIPEMLKADGNKK